MEYKDSDGKFLTYGYYYYFYNWYGRNIVCVRVYMESARTE